MTTMNVPETSDGLTQNVDGLYAPMSSVADTEVSTPAPMAEAGSSAPGDWSESLRSTVRDNPLSAVTAAAVLGMLLMRLTR